MSPPCTCGPEPAASPSGGGIDELKGELDLVYQDINAITRDWRTNVETLGDLMNEVKGADSAIEQITDVLSTMNDSSSGMKQALKQMRSLLAGEE